MTVNIIKNGEKMEVAVTGRLDSNNAADLSREINNQITDVKDLTLELKDLAYMSSAGLRVVLECQKNMNAVSGKMVVRNVNELIMEIFETTGFIDILTIEN